MVNLKILKICGIVDSRGELYANNFSFNQERFRRSYRQPNHVGCSDRKKASTERRGVLTETYPSVFVVDLDPEENSFERVSYSYSDVLTRTVEIEFLTEAV